MSKPGCPHGPTGGLNYCSDCLNERNAVRENLEDVRQRLARLEHEEHIQRRLADGWYALHFCRQCRAEWDQGEKP